MTISEESVRNAAKEMNGGTAPSETAVRGACRRLGAMVRDDITPEELVNFSGSINYAAVLMALRDSAAADNSPLDIRAGDVSIRSPRTSQELSSILKETLEFLRPVLKAEGRECFAALEWRGCL